MNTSLYECALRALYSRVVDEELRAQLELLNPEFSFSFERQPVSGGAVIGRSSSDATSNDPPGGPLAPMSMSMSVSLAQQRPPAPEAGPDVRSHVGDALLHLEELCAPLPSAPALELHDLQQATTSDEVRPYTRIMYRY